MCWLCRCVIGSFFVGCLGVSCLFFDCCYFVSVLMTKMFQRHALLVVCGMCLLCVVLFWLGVSIVLVVCVIVLFGG